MKNVHALLVGAAAALLTALIGWLGGLDPASLSHSPLVISMIGVAIAAASRGLGALLGKVS